MFCAWTCSQVATAADPDWSSNFSIPLGSDRANPYNLRSDEMEAVLTRGRLHALVYPVEPTGLLIPWNAFDQFLSGDGQDLLRKLIGGLASEYSGFHSMNELTQWVGLQKYPVASAEGPNPYQIPYPTDQYPIFRMGTSLRNVSEDVGATFGCATCHAGNLFGRRVLGLTNRFPRANEFFLKAKNVLPHVSPASFQFITGATDGEREMYRRTVHNLQWIQAKKPAVLGLDTSLAQVALSLALRETDDYAEKTNHSAKHPRDSLMAHLVADSKPAVWWNLKYKTRWLSDGSIVAGNPIFTNFLWNELGRGVDLHQLEEWMQRNKELEREITSAVFATEAPRWTDFFAPDSIDLDQAKKGENIFNGNCAGCHGRYEKAWSFGNAGLSPREMLLTTRVFYHEKTPVINVGTDGNRALGMSAFADQLNVLKISKTMGTRVEVQSGYVPPPLVGIWSRWPYFHNNSVPSLCAVLTRSEDRPQKFWMGEALDPNTDFDHGCVGYPSGNHVPNSWRHRERLYDTSKDGMRNIGHDRGIFLDADGRERLTSDDKYALIEFLKTL